MIRDNVLLYGSPGILGTQREAFKWKVQEALLSLDYWSLFFPIRSWFKGYTKDLEMPVWVGRKEIRAGDWTWKGSKRVTVSVCISSTRDGENCIEWLLLKLPRNIMALGMCKWVFAQFHFFFYLSEGTNDSRSSVFLQFWEVRDRKESLVLTMVNFMITAYCWYWVIPPEYCKQF